MTGRTGARPAPLVSVLLPAWNAAATLHEALRSLRRQRSAPGAALPEFEVVLVNDGSDDDTGQLLDHWAGADGLGGRLRVLHLPHGGIARALNAGLDCARGRYVARMDADDTAHPERLARQAAHLEGDDGLTLSASRVAFGGDPQAAPGFAHYVDWQNSLLSATDIARARFRDAPVCHPSVMFRRVAVTRWGGYRDGAFAEDWELWLRWLDAGARMEKLPQTLLTWNDPPARATRVDRRYAREALDRLRAPWLSRHLERHNPFHPDVWVLGAGRVARRRLRALWARGPRPAAWVDIDPRKIGNRVEGAPVVGRASLPAPGNCRILNALTAHGAATEAAAWLASAGHGPSCWLLV